MFDQTHMDGGWWVLMTLFWLILVVIIVWALVTLLSRGGVERRPGHETPQDRLDRRLAEGEIDVETYDELARRLRNDRDRVGVQP